VPEYGQMPTASLFLLCGRFLVNFQAQRCWASLAHIWLATRQRDNGHEW